MFVFQSAEGAHLSWEPPANSAGTISEYSVYLGLKPQPGAQPGTMAFARLKWPPLRLIVIKTTFNIHFNAQKHTMHT